MSLPEKMLEFRAKKRLTIKDAAQGVHITPQTWCAIEKGKSPSRVTAERIRLYIACTDPTGNFNTSQNT